VLHVLRGRGDWPAYHTHASRRRGRGGTTAIPWGTVVVHAFVLNLEALAPNLEAVHLLDGTLRGDDAIVGNKSESLGLTRMAIDVDLSRDDIAKLIEEGGKIGVGQVVREVVDEKVGARGALTGSLDTHGGRVAAARLVVVPLLRALVVVGGGPLAIGVAHARVRRRERALRTVWTRWRALGLLLGWLIFLLVLATVLPAGGRSTVGRVRGRRRGHAVGARLLVHESWVGNVVLGSAVGASVSAGTISVSSRHRASRPHAHMVGLAMELMPPLVRGVHVHPWRLGVITVWARACCASWGARVTLLHPPTLLRPALRLAHLRGRIGHLLIPASRVAVAPALAPASTAPLVVRVSVLDNDGTIHSLQRDGIVEGLNGRVSLLPSAHPDEAAPPSSAVGVANDVDVLDCAVRLEHSLDVHLVHGAGEHANEEFVLFEVALPLISLITMLLLLVPLPPPPWPLTSATRTCIAFRAPSSLTRS